MAGAEDLVGTGNPLLSAVAGSFTREGEVRFAFVPAGEAVDKGDYGGGDDLTRAWTEEEKDAFRAVTARYMEVSDLMLVEIADHMQADVQAQIVDRVPGGWAGYAGTGTTFVVGNTSEILLTHEFGHSVGLGHPFDTGFGTTVLPGVDSSDDPGDYGFNSKFYTVESYQFGTLPEYPDVDVADPTGLMALDIAALQALYGANEEFRRGDDIYGATGEFRTLWDAGGTDRIDFSRLLTDTVIDLRAASFEVGPGGLGRPSLTDTSAEARDVGGYMIAYGAVIENGTAGSGDDLLTGNGAANLLQGGPGDDTLAGGAGDDVLTGGPDTIAAIPLVELNDAQASDRALLTEDLAMPGSVTFDLVLRLDPGGPDFSRLLSWKPEDAADFRFDVQYFAKTSDGTDGYLSVIYRTDENTSQSLSVGIREEELLDGDEHRLTLSRDAQTGMVRAYLDGIYQHEREIDPGTAFTPDGTLVIGQSQGVWVPADSPRAAFRGAVGEIAIYDGVLDADEISRGSIVALADPADPRLVAHWRPDVQAGDIETLAGSADLLAVNIARVHEVPFASDDDRLEGGMGDDTILGGSGTDTAVIAAAEGEYAVTTAPEGLRITSVLGTDFISDDVEQVEFADTTLGFADLSAIGLDSPVLGGTSGPDTLTGSVADERIMGFSGDDWLRPGGGSDTLDGGAGRDMADFYAFPDSDQILLRLDLAAGTADPLGPAFHRLAGIEDATGTDGADRLGGDDLDNRLVGLDGADRLLGLGGDDWLNGGQGPDTINGGDGDDRLIGGPDGHEADQRDVILGGTGDDSAEGGGGNDLLYGQEGNDTLAGGCGADELQGQQGDDVVTGGALSDLVYGGDGNDFVNGGFGYDRINGGDGADRFFHLGVADHGSDWVQDYDAVEGDTLVFGNPAVTPDQFQINLAHTATPDGDRSGDDTVQEAFVIYRPTGQIMWALVDGEGQDSIVLQIGTDSFDLMT
ncbi:M10 family metallopeptidase C-terminal domain-containing protein [Cribrihabitans sp. XS_ASV171]